MGDGLRRNLPSAKLARIANDLELTLKRFVGNLSSSSKSSLMSVRKGLRVSKVSKAEAGPERKLQGKCGFGFERQPISRR